MPRSEWDDVLSSLVSLTPRHWRVSREWRVSIIDDPQDKWDAIKSLAAGRGGLYVPAARNKTASVAAGFLFKSQEIAIEVAKEIDLISPH